MRDRGYIIAGLVVFLALITFPVWWNVAQGKTSKGPDLKLPAAAKAMRGAHRVHEELAHGTAYRWREEVVRKGNRTFTSYDGKSYNMSLSGTCLRVPRRTRPSSATAATATPPCKAPTAGTATWIREKGTPAKIGTEPNFPGRPAIPATAAVGKSGSVPIFLRSSR